MQKLLLALVILLSIPVNAIDFPKTLKLTDSAMASAICLVRNHIRGIKFNKTEIYSKYSDVIWAIIDERDKLNNGGSLRFRVEKIGNDLIKSDEYAISAMGEKAGCKQINIEIKAEFKL